MPDRTKQLQYAVVCAESLLDACENLENARNDLAALGQEIVAFTPPVRDQHAGLYVATITHRGLVSTETRWGDPKNPDSLPTVFYLYHGEEGVLGAIPLELTATPDVRAALNDAREYEHGGAELASQIREANPILGRGPAAG